MILIETHIIDTNLELEELTFNCKNLYNKANYIIRQEFILNGKFISKFEMFNICKTLEEYKCMPARVSRGVLRTLDGNWLSFFSCIKKWKENKNLFKGKPNLPKYLPKDGKFTAIFSDGAFKKPKDGKIGFSGINLRINTQIKGKLIEAQIKPLKNNKFKIQLAYDYKEEKLKENNNLYCSIDLGLNNLVTITSNKQGLQPLIINGRILKSINQYYNKKNANLQSQLPKGNYNSKQINKLAFKRECKINDYLHKSSKLIIDYCLENKLNTLIIGYNEFWKQKINLGSKNNQNFVQIPFSKLIFMLEYKCKKEGINFITNEESYTSKCSFLDNEEIKKHENYLGKRVKRGLFISKEGKLINADVNGSLNILKKAAPIAFSNGVEGIAVYPIKLSIPKR